MANESSGRLTVLGVLVSMVLVIGLVGVGSYVLIKKPTLNPGPAPIAPSGAIQRTPGEGKAGLESLAVKAPESVPTLAAPSAYVPKDNIVDIELSEYAGYAGLIAANGGLEPNDASVFARKHGFKVRITLSEEEGWDRLNTGRIGATATTADVLAVFGRQFHAVVPVQIAFSRGADGIVVRNEIKRINDLKGKVVVTTQYTEAEFFLRFLAQEAGAPVRVLEDLKVGPDMEAINLVFAGDGDEAGALFAQELKAGTGRLAGCVTWDPTTTEVVEGSEGKAKLLVTNRNLLIIADLLVINRSFAESNPKMIEGLVDGVLEGNRMMGTNADQHLAVVGKALGWDTAKTRSELAKVHFSNLPENQAFFSGAIDMAGSFGGIYQSSVLAYGAGIIRNPTDSDRFLSLAALGAIEKTGAYKDQAILIKPIKTEKTGGLENDPLLSKDIRFLFQPNDAILDPNSKANAENIQTIKKLLQVSPGSFVLLRGHADNTKVEEFRRTGGEALVRTKALEAVKLSKDRAAEIRRILIEVEKIDEKRLETIGRGWEEPAGTDMDKNRRVEVYWYTLE